MISILFGISPTYAEDVPAFPHGFVHIIVDKPVARWYFFPTGNVPIKFGQKEYGFNLLASSGDPMPNGGVLCAMVEAGNVQLGTELIGRTLDGIIFSNTLKDKSSIETSLTNSINQMVGKPDAAKTATDLHGILGSVSTIVSLAAEERDFYLFSPDGEKLQVLPKESAKQSCIWLAEEMSNAPDGQETSIADDASDRIDNADLPQVTPQPLCQNGPSKCWTILKERVYWRPGSGKNGCLGQLRISNGTDIYTHAICTPQ